LAPRLLRGEQAIEPQVVAVRRLSGEVELEPGVRDPDVGHAIGVRPGVAPGSLPRNDTVHGRARVRRGPRPGEARAGGAGDLTPATAGPPSPPPPRGARAAALRAHVPGGVGRGARRQLRGAVARPGTRWAGAVRPGDRPAVRRLPQSAANPGGAPAAR